MKLSHRLLTLAVGASLVTALVGAVALWVEATLSASLKTVYEDRTVPAAQIGEISELLAANRMLVTEAAQEPDAAHRDGKLKAVVANRDRIGEVWKAYMATYLTEEERALAAEFVKARDAWLKNGLMAAIEALRAGDAKRASHVVADGFPRLFPPVLAAAQKLRQLQVDEGKKEYEAAVAQGQRVRVVLVLLAGLGFVAALGYGLHTARRVTRALGAEPDEVRSVAEAVARGDLTTPIALRAGDTLSVMAAMAAMRDNLSATVRTVRGNAESVASASAQIAGGNQDLSARTEHQASALQQTAASMEELGSTVRQNADNARQANQLAQSASQVASNGGQVVAQVVGTMRGIQDSSRRIADIISVIDSIAFQTNILALNAAVEAARAGEQGRGFAVVAGEVRSLAQRSAEAAREIKGLIGASVERVEQGTALVDQAGSTMQEIVSSIQRVADIMGEITAASAEQSSGVAQVGQAVTQMDTATQQNAALVEQSAAAAESLKAQAQALVRAVATFRLA